MATSPLRSLRRLQRGVAAVELALVLPVLLLLIFTTTEFGRAVYHYGVLTHSVRQAVRYLSTQTPGEGVETARKLVIYGNPEGTGAPQLPGLGASQVPAPSWEYLGAAPPIQVVTVRVTGYRFQSMLTTFFGQRLLGPIIFSDITASMRADP